MRLQVYQNRERKFVTETTPGKVGEVMGYIHEMLADQQGMVVVLDSDRYPNVCYIVRKVKRR